jgi:hypothetical protein
MSKISIKYGSVQVEYEGSDDFIRDELLNFLSSVAELAEGAEGNTSSSSPGGRASAGSVPNISVKTISSKLGNAKGSDLARAAAAFLTLVQNRETFTQADLLNAMKTATGIFKQSTHSKNIGTIVSGLIGSGFLIETSSGTYSVAQSQRDQLAVTLNSMN